MQGAGGISKKAADEKAKEEFDAFSQKRRRLKETEGARANIVVLKDLLKKGKQKNNIFTIHINKIKL